jgi:hypothetical protein
MTKRFYKATDGSLTVFRATDTKVYQSATITNWGSEAKPRLNISFSGKAAGVGAMPAIEITKAEYDALTSLKLRRMRAMGEAIRYSTSPSHSWVANDVIEPFSPLTGD